MVVILADFKKKQKSSEIVYCVIPFLALKTTIASN